MVAGVEDDSLSEGSAISDVDDDADAEGSEASDTESTDRRLAKAKSATNGHSEGPNNPARQSTVLSKKQSVSTNMHDTEAMMNGLNISAGIDEGEEMHFDEMMEQQPEEILQEEFTHDSVEVAPLDTLGEKRRREHEEYRKKRDADPAFVPNRGGFFMHDQRSAAPGQNGFRPFGRGRGRGRGAIGGSSPAASQLPSSSGPADAQWAHDLHESIAQPPVDTNGLQAIPSHPNMQDYSKPSSSSSKAQLPNRSFSRTTRIGNIQIRVYIAGMSDPITFSAVPVNQHTRLPHHRPPLRRDKPVRVSLPEVPLKYIFPSTDRSFIFIPRALRPNQQGFGRARGRGSFGGYSGFAGLSSRRTSAYAGSAYSPSVAMSRRSSLVREVSADGIISPAGAIPARVSGVSTEPTKPRVRLPPAMEQTQGVSQEALAGADMAPMPHQSYPLPQKPTFRENRPVPIPMHQPRPQKTVSVADIESPATLDFNPPQQQQQPFHQQVPVQVTGQMYAPELSLVPHSRHASYPSQASGGTPLSQIPERAIHAQPFQPYPYQQPPIFYPQQFSPPTYYYPTVEHIPGGAAAPPFVPGQQYPYHLPIPPPAPPTEPTTQAGTVAHESNGMVYYYDSSQLAAGAENTTVYPIAGYPMPQPGGVIGVGGMMTPPVHYFTQPTPAVFYPAQ